MSSSSNDNNDPPREDASKIKEKEHTTEWDGIMEKLKNDAATGSAPSSAAGAAGSASESMVPRSENVFSGVLGNVGTHPNEKSQVTYKEHVLSKRGENRAISKGSGYS
jgi:hypothetical protein